MYICKSRLLWVILIFLVAGACVPDPVNQVTPLDPAIITAEKTPTLRPLTQTSPPTPPAETTASAAMQNFTPEPDLNSDKADVLSVQVRGEPGSYQFVVEVHSPDTGCDQYADWWEVISAEGELLYRRILLHSHVDEQPFVRSGGPVPIQADTVIWVRAHLNTSGYGGQALHGSTIDGFSPASFPESFAAGVEAQPPLPKDCAF